MDRPTVLYILYTMVSAQQTNLLPKNALRNDAIFAQKGYRIYATTSQYLSPVVVQSPWYIYNIYYGDCATDDPLPENVFQNDAIFAQSLFTLM